MEGVISPLQVTQEVICSPVQETQPSISTMAKLIDFGLSGTCVEADGRNCVDK